MNPQKDASFWRQLYSCISVYTMAITIGTLSGLSGVALPQLEEEFYFSKVESALFASLPQLGMISTCIIGGFLGQKFGHRNCTLGFAPLHIVGLFFQILAPSSAYLFIGRFFNGMVAGLTSGVVPVYISEISTTKYRTSLGAGISVSYLIGTNFVYFFGSLLKWRIVLWMTLIFPVAGILMLLSVPESPMWYVTKDRLEEAKKGLVWLRGSKYDGIEEEIESIRTHFTELQTSSRTNSERKMLYRISRLANIFQRPDVYKPLLIVMTLMVLQQFCGMSAITYYAIKILLSAKSSLDVYLCTNIFGLVRLLAQFLGSYLLTRYRRRTLFIGSTLFMGIGNSLLGIGIYYNKNSASPYNEWIIGALPILGVVISAAAYPLGLSPIPWSYTSELFPVDVRAIMCGVTNCFANIYIFSVVLSFPFISEYLGESGTFWMFSSVCVLVIIFSLFFLPETKGLRMEEVSKSFRDGKSKKENENEVQDLL